MNSLNYKTLSFINTGFLPLAERQIKNLEVKKKEKSSFLSYQSWKKLKQSVGSWICNRRRFAYPDDKQKR